MKQKYKILKIKKNIILSDGSFLQLNDYQNQINERSLDMLLHNAWKKKSIKNVEQNVDTFLLYYKKK